MSTSITVTVTYTTTTFNSLATGTSFATATVSVSDPGNLVTAKMVPEIPEPNANQSLVMSIPTNSDFWTNGMQIITQFSKDYQFVGASFSLDPSIGLGGAAFFPTVTVQHAPVGTPSMTFTVSPAGLTNQTGQKLGYTFCLFVQQLSGTCPVGFIDPDIEASVIG